MIKLSREQEKTTLVAVLAVLALLIAYRIMTSEQQRTMPLAFTRGSVASSAVRSGSHTASGGADILNVFIVQRQEKYPGVSRDIFRMENPAPKPKPKPAAAPVAVAPPAPVVPQKTPEEIASELARADLARFRFLGYLSDKVKTLFLSKDSELFMVKVGDTLGKTYLVKEASQDAVILVDTATRVEARVDLSGSDASQKQTSFASTPQPQPVRAQAAAPQPNAVQRFQAPPAQPQQSAIMKQERPAPSMLQNIMGHAEPNVTDAPPEDFTGPDRPTRRRLLPQRQK